jgi:hypothetical protein
MPTLSAIPYIQITYDTSFRISKSARLLKYFPGELGATVFPAVSSSFRCVPFRHQPNSAFYLSQMTRDITLELILQESKSPRKEVYSRLKSGLYLLGDPRIWQMQLQFVEAGRSSEIWERVICTSIEAWAQRLTDWLSIY